jgi:hypothetical protein
MGRGVEDGSARRVLNRRNARLERFGSEGDGREGFVVRKRVRERCDGG